MTNLEQIQTVDLARELKQRYGSAYLFVISAALYNSKMSKRRTIVRHLKKGMKEAETDFDKGTTTIYKTLLRDLWPAVVSSRSRSGKRAQYIKDFAIMVTTFPLSVRKSMQQSILDMIVPPTPPGTPLPSPTR